MSQVLRQLQAQSTSSTLLWVISLTVSGRLTEGWTAESQNPKL